MPVILGQQASLPNNLEADANGLVAIGGNLSPSYLIQAYSKGVFPWNEGGMPPFWYSPDPRLILRPLDFKVSKSLRNVLNRGQFEISLNQSFREVIQNCGTIKRPDQEGTWLHEELMESLILLHQQGVAQSVEVRLNNTLVGGLYGLKIGKVFFGESMFTKVANASKIGLYNLCRSLPSDAIIDCQQETAHLLSLGAESISRKDFESILSNLIKQDFSLQLKPHSS